MKPRGDLPGGVEGNPRIGESERLLRHDAVGAAVTLEDVGVVEHGEEFVFLIRGMGEVETAPFRRSVRRHRRTAHGRIQPSREMEETIAHDLRFHATRIRPPIEPVRRIGGESRGIATGIRGTAPVSLRGDEEAVEVLEAPARLDELGRKPIEQGVMLGPRCLAPEIEDALDERLAEMTHPDLVYRDPRGEGILARGDPLREHEATPRAGRRKGRAVAVFLVFRSFESLLRTAQRGVGRVLGRDLLCGGGKRFLRRFHFLRITLRPESEEVELRTSP